jgi:hypothetical protein
MSLFEDWFIKQDKYTSIETGRFMMKVNESKLDRIIRVVLGVVLLALFLTNVVTGTLGIVFVVLAAVAIITGLVGFCPLYALLKIRTNK